MRSLFCFQCSVCGSTSFAVRAFEIRWETHLFHVSAAVMLRAGLRSPRRTGIREFVSIEGEVTRPVSEFRSDQGICVEAAIMRHCAQS